MKRHVLSTRKCPCAGYRTRSVQKLISLMWQGQLPDWAPQPMLVLTGTLGLRTLGERLAAPPVSLQRCRHSKILGSLLDRAKTVWGKKKKKITWHRSFCFVSVPAWNRGGYISFFLSLSRKKKKKKRKIKLVLPVYWRFAFVLLFHQSALYF